MTLASGNPLTIVELCDLAYANADAKGFHPADPPEPTTLEEALQQLQELRSRLRLAYFFQRTMLVVTELVEAVEARRKGAPTEENTSLRGEKPEGIPSEIADVFIRLGDMCKEFGIPIEDAIWEKMAFNQTRPYMHGKNS